MSSPERSLLQAALALARTLLLIAALLWAAVWLVSQIWVWLVVIGCGIGVFGLLLWWLRARRDRW
ncbi:Flp pilus assembly protein TadB [Microbacterium testaceum]|nr:Flp pilus assembly protein TadB [Microbacterium testaceum]